jgi:LmbE family N-acetylglucosaminyl deacetylase
MTSGDVQRRIAFLRAALSCSRPLLLENVPWPPGLRVLVLAPHPDDFDAIAVTLRFFRDRGDEIRLSVISSSPGGVEDSYCSPPTAGAKAALREREQQESCRLFGLPEDRLVFLHLPEDESGHPIDSDKNFGRLRSHLLDIRPDLFFLPHGNDTNPGHRFTFRMLRRFAEQAYFPFSALLNRDPKTLEMRADLYTFFEDGDARWKADLLRCHRSQHQRNLNVRGHGLDERILQVNRRSAAELPGRGPYAEAFEIWPVDSGSGTR